MKDEKTLKSSSAFYAASFSTEKELAKIMKESGPVASPKWKVEANMGKDLTQL